MLACPIFTTELSTLHNAITQFRNGLDSYLKTGNPSNIRDFHVSIPEAERLLEMYILKFQEKSLELIDIWGKSLTQKDQFNRLDITFDPADNRIILNKDIRIFGKEIIPAMIKEVKDVTFRETNHADLSHLEKVKLITAPATVDYLIGKNLRSLYILNMTSIKEAHLPMLQEAFRISNAGHQYVSLDAPQLKNCNEVNGYFKHLNLESLEDVEKEFNVTLLPSTPDAPPEFATYTLSQLAHCGEFTLLGPKRVDLKSLKTAYKIESDAFEFKAPELTHLDENGNRGMLRLSNVEYLDLPKFKIGNIQAARTLSFLAPQMLQGSIQVPFAEKVDLTSLTFSQNIGVLSADKVDLPSLKGTGGNNKVELFANAATSISAPLVKDWSALYAWKATTVNVPLTETITHIYIKNMTQAILDGMPALQKLEQCHCGTPESVALLKELNMKDRRKYPRGEIVPDYRPSIRS